jgi:DNA polymerase-4
MDAFFVSVEVLLDPSLAGKPVVVGGRGRRGVVAAASYEARRHGVRSGMPGVQAARLCPQAVFLPGRRSEYRRFSERVFALLRGYTPLVRVVSVDEAYMDMTGTERLWGPPLRVGEEILRRIREEIGLPASLGIATNKLVAKVASDFGKPRGLTWVRPGFEAAFFRPLPVGALPGIGKRAEGQLALLGIRTLGDLAAYDPDRLRRLLGDWAVELIPRARGEGSDRVVLARGRPKSISHERTFAEDLHDRGELEAVLARLCGMVGRRLRAAGLLAWTVQLKLRYGDFTTLTRHLTLENPTDIDGVLFQSARRLFRRNHQLGRGVRLLGMGVSRLTSGGYQRDLFDEARRDRLRSLDRSVDRIRTRFGADGVFRAVELPGLAVRQRARSLGSAGAAVPSAGRP